MSILRNDLSADLMTGLDREEAHPESSRRSKNIRSLGLEKKKTMNSTIERTNCNYGANCSTCSTSLCLCRVRGDHAAVPERCAPYWVMAGASVICIPSGVFVVQYREAYWWLITYVSASKNSPNCLYCNCANSNRGTTESGWCG